MNKDRRFRQKSNRAASGGHTMQDHQQEPDPDHPGKVRSVRCEICRPLPKKWDRSLSGRAVDDAR